MLKHKSHRTTKLRSEAVEPDFHVVGKMEWARAHKRRHQMASPPHVQLHYMATSTREKAWRLHNASRHKSRCGMGGIQWTSKRKAGTALQSRLLSNPSSGKWCPTTNLAKTSLYCMWEDLPEVIVQPPNLGGFHTPNHRGPEYFRVCFIACHMDRCSLRHQGSFFTRCCITTTHGLEDKQQFAGCASPSPLQPQAVICVPQAL